MRPKTKPTRAFVDTSRASIARVIVAPIPTAAQLIVGPRGARLAIVAVTLATRARSVPE